MRGRRNEGVFGAVARHWLSERRCQKAGCARASPGGRVRGVEENSGGPAPC